MHAGGAAFDPVPGKEIRIPADRGTRACVVYVPADYDPGRPWPAAFHYHGLNGAPDTSFLRRLTGGRGLVIVGMEYLERGSVRRTAEEQRDYTRREAEQILRVRSNLEESLNVDRERVYLTGISKGGWQVSSFLDFGMKGIAGAMILLAGRVPSEESPSDVGTAGKPVYIGVGELEGTNVFARVAARGFSDAGARVTFEEYGGRDHAVDPDAPRLRAWAELHLLSSAAGRRARAEAWLEGVRDAFGRTDGDAARYRLLTEAMGHPLFPFCPRGERERVASLSEALCRESPLREEAAAREAFEDAIERLCRPPSRTNTDAVLKAFRAAAEYEGTEYGGKAAREVDRLEEALGIDERKPRPRPRGIPPPRIRIR
jgi:poly(3-hydroxybutyrate) depolymerase